MSKPTEDQSMRRIENQVSKTIEVSDVLAGRKEIPGRLGDKLKKKQVDEKDIAKGASQRIEKYKIFDDWCDRIEEIVNPVGQKSIKVKRALVVKQDDPTKSI